MRQRQLKRQLRRNRDAISREMGRKHAHIKEELKEEAKYKIIKIGFWGRIKVAWKVLTMSVD